MKFSPRLAVCVSALFLLVAACDEPKPQPSTTPSATPPSVSATTNSALPAASNSAVVAETRSKPGAEPAEWTIDTAHSRVGFNVKHLLITTVRGQFKTFSGKAFIDEATPANSKLNVEVDMKSIDTNEPKRDEHLRSPDFFDVAKYPKMTFVSTTVERAGEGMKITGDLTLHGVTKPFVLNVDSLTPEIDSPWPGYKLRGAHASGKLNRKDFGVSWEGPSNGTAVVADEINIDLDVELKREVKASTTDGGKTAAAASATTMPTAAPKATASAPAKQ